MISYADDCTIMGPGPNINELCYQLNDYLKVLDRFRREKIATALAWKINSDILYDIDQWNEPPLDIRIRNHVLHIRNYWGGNVLGATFDQLQHTWQIKETQQHGEKVNRI